MVNGPIHEWERDAGTEAGHETDSERLQVPEELAAAARRRETQCELGEAIPQLRRLSRQEPVMPSAAQWTAFSRELSKRLDEEERTAKSVSWRTSLRDRLSATDSHAIRAGVAAVVTAVVAALIATLVWLAGELAPASAPAAAITAPPAWTIINGIEHRAEFANV